MAESKVFISWLFSDDIGSFYAEKLQSLENKNMWKRNEWMGANVENS